MNIPTRKTSARAPRVRLLPVIAMLACAMSIWAQADETAPESGEAERIAAEQALDVLIDSANERIREAGEFTDELKRELMKELSELADAHPGTDAAVDALINQGAIASLLEEYEEAEAIYGRAAGMTKNPEILAGIQRHLRRLELRPGTKLPEFSVTTVDDRTVTSSDYKGKVLLIDFWATWCAPCIVELPVLKQAHAEYKESGFEILGVSVDEDIELLRGFIEAEAMTWTHVHDLTWVMRGEPEDLAAQFAVESIPHTILVGRDGTILATNLKGQAMIDAVKEATTPTE